MKDRGMLGSTRGMYIRNITLIPPNWQYKHSTADMNELAEIVAINS